MSAPLFPYVVRQGDYLTRLAFVHGFDLDAVWSDPKNDEIRDLRKDHHVLAPGDIVHLPVAPKEGLPITKGQTNRYTAKVPKVPVRIHFADADGPLASKAFVVEGSATPTEGTTDGDGLCALSVSVLVKEVRVRFPDLDMTFTVRVGRLDPVEERSGLASRLAHLGYLPPAVSDHLDAEMAGWRTDNDAALADAVRRFQADHGLDPSGVADGATREAVKKAHGA